MVKEVSNLNFTHKEDGNFAGGFVSGLPELFSTSPCYGNHGLPAPEGIIQDNLILLRHQGLFLAGLGLVGTVK